MSGPINSDFAAVPVLEATDTSTAASQPPPPPQPRPPAQPPAVESKPIDGTSSSITFGVMTDASGLLPSRSARHFSVTDDSPAVSYASVQTSKSLGSGVAPNSYPPGL